MSILANILPIAQIVICAVLVLTILLQQSGSEAGGIFGGSGATYHSRRGFEKILFTTTMIFGILFVLSTIAALIVK